MNALRRPIATALLCALLAGCTADNAAVEEVRVTGGRLSLTEGAVGQEVFVALEFSGAEGVRLPATVGLLVDGRPTLFALEQREAGHGVRFFPLHQGPNVLSLPDGREIGRYAASLSPMKVHGVSLSSARPKTGDQVTPSVTVSADVSAAVAPQGRLPVEAIFRVNGTVVSKTFNEWVRPGERRTVAGEPFVWGWPTEATLDVIVVGAGNVSVPVQPLFPTLRITMERIGNSAWACPDRAEATVHVTNEGYALQDVELVFHAGPRSLDDALREKGTQTRVHVGPLAENESWRQEDIRIDGIQDHCDAFVEEDEYRLLVGVKADGWRVEWPGPTVDFEV